MSRLLVSDFFSQKIHAKAPDWGDWLCQIAYIFNLFHGQKYDRNAIINKFEKWSPEHRVSMVRKAPFWRDEITAYMSHLGVCRIRDEESGAVVRMSETARTYLLGESPDVAAFLRLQLSLLQFPILMGLQRDKKNNLIKQVENARRNFFGMLDAGVRVSPVRLLIAGISADANLNQVDIFQGGISIEEWYILANRQEIMQVAKPDVDKVRQILEEIRIEREQPQEEFEHRISLLQHMDLFDLNHRENGKIRIKIRTHLSDMDKEVILRQIDAISKIDFPFDGYSDYHSKGDISSLRVLSEKWADYHDAEKTLPSDTVKLIASGVSGIGDVEAASEMKYHEETLNFALREFKSNVRPYTARKDVDDSVRANPHITRVLMERRNCMHAAMVRKMYAWLENSARASEIGDSLHIDLWAYLRDGTPYIFEIKSGGENIFQQVRKGVSQLYEYRYRYKDKINDPFLCLVVPDYGLPYSWLPDYLCRDRNINVCYLGVDDMPPNFDPISQVPIREN